MINGHSESTENPDGKRFSQLFFYLDIEFLQETPNVYLTINDEEITFQVFAAFFTNTEFYYIDPNPSDQGFDDLAKTLAEKNEMKKISLDFLKETASAKESIGLGSILFDSQGIRR